MVDEEEDYYQEEENYIDEEEGGGDNTVNMNNVYEFLLKEEIEKERDKKINEFIEYSQLNRGEAELVLMNYNWNMELLNNDWFDRTQKIKEESGLSQTKESLRKIAEYLKKNKITKGVCPICEIEMEPDEIIALGCEHEFCSDCYTEYLKQSLQDELTVIGTPCPIKGCNFIVRPDIFEKCLQNFPEHLQIYNKCLLRNFTDSNSDIKLCPNPKCDVIIKLPGHGMIDVRCQCDYIFCFRCLRPSHRPCDCEMIAYWESKSQSEGENAKWLIVNTKQCPNCHKYIEKNQGCNHMTCQKKAGGCGYEFCWICLGEWAPHGSSWYECKRYNPTDFDKRKEELRKNAKLELERFANYMEGYENEEKAEKFANKLRQKIEEYKATLEKNKNKQHSELKYLDDALNCVIDCHRILKNTYVFGYYMKSDESINAITSLYIHHQDMLRLEADRLHELLEMDKLPEILEISTLDEFNKEYDKFIGVIKSLIGATAKFKENILSEIENHPEIINYNLLKNIEIKGTKLI